MRRVNSISSLLFNYFHAFISSSPPKVPRHRTSVTAEGAPGPQSRGTATGESPEAEIFRVNLPPRGRHRECAAAAVAGPADDLTE